jgi:hypothetical protein
LALLGLAAVVAAIVVLGQREQLVPPEDLVPDPVVREPLVSSGRAPVATETVDRAATLDVVDDALVQLRADTEPRVAVRIAYATVTHGLGRQSFARRAAETEGEYLARLLDELGAGSADLTELTDLFTHARFSDEPIDEEMRRAAIAALSRLRSVLHADGAAPAGRRADHGQGT